MYIQNATYKAVPTAGLTFPLAEGTVLTVGDVTGIVPENISLAAPTGLIYLAVGGTIDLTSEANAGVSFTDAEMNALGGDFNFVPKAESSGLPSYTSADIGKVLTVGEGEGGTVEPKWEAATTKYVLNIGWDDDNSVEYIEKSSLDYILVNSPDIIEFTGDGALLYGDRVKNAVTNEPDYKFVCYSLSVVTGGATGIMITVPGIFYDDSEADSIFISESATEDTSGQYPVWAPDVKEFAYNSTRNRYEAQQQ